MKLGDSLSTSASRSRESLASGLSGVLGDKVVSEVQILKLYSRDASTESGVLPVSLVFAESVEDVRAALRFALDNGLKLIAVGSSTSLAGNSVPKAEDTLILSMERMSKILEISEIDWVARVQPGIRVDELNYELARHGLQWPVDPASSKSATVGGVIADGGGGTKGAKYGSSPYWISALEVVTGTGDVLRLGCRTVKCREGYDLLHLFIGSEGTLGIVTEATLRLAPLPEAFVGVMAEFDGMGQLVSSVVEARRRRLWPMVTEFLDSETSEALGLKGKYHLWAGTDVNAGSEEGVLSKLSGAVTDAGGRIVAVARNMADFMTAMAPRRALYSGGLNVGFNMYGTDALVFWEDIAVPISELPAAVEELLKLGNDFGIKLLLGGHIGDGNLHPGLLVRRTAPEDEVKKYMSLIEKIGELAIRHGGTVSAEHGIGVQKKGLISMKYRSTGSEAALEAMRSVKRIFDPHNVLNPGKVLP